ncbi:hypothetical protein G6011_03998 [Alternaria panax]|uniref:Uncharacterized protein n=1 Tax=Alternaria panax TaxID=48097 RepID=A0AAD4IGE5_9PLEO|nr:hypothetical protein G6011_03998 [Alternaria panax]
MEIHVFAIPKSISESGIRAFLIADRLPPSLFTVYQTYKRGTSVIIEWLNTLNSGSPEKRNTFDTAPAASNVTVKQLLEQVSVVANRKRTPPATIHDDFRVILVNREKLIKHYEDRPAASAETEAATTRHKALNEQDMFAAVIHLYNLLQQIDVGCPQIRILEELDSRFRSVVLAGKQEPRGNSASVFELFCGTKIYKTREAAQTMLKPAPGRQSHEAFCEDERINLNTMGLSAEVSFVNLYAPTGNIWIKTQAIRK